MGENICKRNLTKDLYLEYIKKSEIYKTYKEVPKIKGKKRDINPVKRWAN